MQQRFMQRFVGKSFGVLGRSSHRIRLKTFFAFSALVILPLQLFFSLKLSFETTDLLSLSLGNVWCGGAFLGTKAVVLGHANENTDADIAGILVFNAHSIYEPHEEKGVLVEDKIVDREDEKIHALSGEWLVSRNNILTNGVWIVRYRTQNWDWSAATYCMHIFWFSADSC